MSLTQRPFLIILCGIPCSGKSTLAKRIGTLMEERFKCAVVVVPSDAFRDMVPNYKAQFEELEHFVHGATYAVIQEALMNGLVVISDDTNYYQSIRRRLVKIAQQCKSGYAIVYVNTPLEVALEWNKGRGEPVPNGVLEEIGYKMDEPGKQYKWDAPLISVDLSDGRLDGHAVVVAEMVHERMSMGHPIEMKTLPSKQPSLRTDLERETRRAMGEMVKRLGKLASIDQISNVRRDIVQEALDKGLCPPEAVKMFFERTEGLLVQEPAEAAPGTVPVHVGLFGHVDHGKTKLAICLTEKPSTASLDRHPEAQRRGMSIDMGFSAFSLGKYLVTLVDLPGHYSLIKHAVSGANIIDLGVLVVAADEGPGVQTLEHFQVLDALGIRGIVVAINKMDLVDEKRLSQVRGEVGALLTGTRFEGSPMACISAIKCEGIQELKNALLEHIGLPVRQWSGNLRIPISHAFNIVGIGTVATGTVLRGKAKLGDIVEIRPSGKQCKIKIIQVFGQSREEAVAGDRVGIALSGIHPHDLSRGHVIVAQGTLMEKGMMEVKLNTQKSYGLAVQAGSVIHVNVSMQIISGKIFPYLTLGERKILKKSVEPGSTCSALIKLDEPAPVEVGDKALLMKLDLPPKRSRVIGAADVTGLPESAPEIYTAKVKKGTVSERAQDGAYIVTGLFSSKEAAQSLIGESVITASKIKGTIASSHGDKGDTLVNFKELPKLMENVYWYKLRKITIAGL